MLVCSSNTQCPGARHWADKTPAEKTGQVQTLPSRVSEARSLQLSVCMHVQLLAAAKLR